MSYWHSSAPDGLLSPPQPEDPERTAAAARTPRGGTYSEPPLPFPGLCRPMRGGKLPRSPQATQFTMKKLLACLALALSACGGGGGGDHSVPTLSVGGVYFGNLGSASSSYSQMVLGLVAEDGRTFLISLGEGARYSGRLTARGDTFTGKLRGYLPEGGEAVFANGRHTVDALFNGTILEREQLEGTHTLQGAQGTFTLNYSPEDYDRPSSLSLLAGGWDSFMDDEPLRWDITPAGNITGTSAYGCSYTGTVSIIDPGYNMYGLQVTRVCSGVAASLNGLLTYFPPSDNLPPLFILGLADNSTAFSSLFTKRQ